MRPLRQVPQLVVAWVPVAVVEKRELVAAGPLVRVAGPQVVLAAGFGLVAPLLLVPVVPLVRSLPDIRGI